MFDLNHPRVLYFLNVFGRNPSVVLFRPTFPLNEGFPLLSLQYFFDSEQSFIIRLHFLKILFVENALQSCLIPFLNFVSRSVSEEAIEEAVESLHSHIHNPTINDSTDETMIQLIQHSLFS